MSARGLVDSPCHLDASEFDEDRDAVVQAALDGGVEKIIVPAIACWNFDTVLALPQRYPCCVPALGIHPLFVGQAQPDDIEILRDKLRETRRLR